MIERWSNKNEGGFILHDILCIKSMKVSKICNISSKHITCISYMLHLVSETLIKESSISGTLFSV